MEVITQRPIYNYASGEDDFSYLTKEEKATKRKENAQKRKEKVNALLQNDELLPPAHGMCICDLTLPNAASLGNCSLELPYSQLGAHRSSASTTTPANM